jgi:thiol-disulfide isomerase/thioredoxin
MPITFDCAGCGKFYTVPDTLGGRSGRCKQCGTPNVIPKLQPKQATDAPAAAAVPPKAAAPPAKKRLLSATPPSEGEEIIGAEIVEPDEPARSETETEEAPPKKPRRQPREEPGEDEAAEEQEETRPRKKFRKKVQEPSAMLYWILGGSSAVFLLLLGGLGAAAYFLVITASGDPKPVVGRTAPDIEGEDSAGQAFKLSDYRGKVVVLTFWASWCGPCMANVPHERSLVQKLEGKPFALLGVNLDVNREALQRVERDARINWRSWWDGRGGTISPVWEIRYVPTIYVLDHKGMIRYKDVRGPHLDEAVNKLLKEVQ